MTAAEERVVESVARAIYDEDRVPSCATPWESAAPLVQGAYRRLAVASVAAYRAAQDGGEGYHVELGGQRFTQAQWEAMLVWRIGTHMPADAQDGGAEVLRHALLKHHPIAHTMAGPLKGCRCGQVSIGQDVIAHVAAELRAALAPQAGDGAR